MATFLFCLITLFGPVVIVGAIGQALAIALGYIDPWDLR